MVPPMVPPAAELAGLPPHVRQPWQATWWVQFFELLGPSFPAPDAPQDQWRHFVVSCSLWPSVLILLGLVLALGTLCSTCSSSSRARWRLRRPSTMPSALIGLLVLLLIGSGVYVYTQTGMKAANTAQQELDRAVQDASTASAEGVKLQGVGVSVLASLDAIAPACPEAVRPQVRDKVAPLQRQARGYVDQVTQFQTEVDPLQGQLRNAKGKFAGVAQFVFGGTLVPTALVLLCCLTALFAVLCAPKASCGSCCVRCLGPLAFAPSILIIAVAAGLHFEVAVLAGSFCSKVDENTLAYIEHAAGANSTDYAISRYYIEGRGENPLQQELGRAQAELASVNATVVGFQQNLKQLCPDWEGPEKIFTAISEADASLEVGRDLLSTSNVYPYYEKVVREDACRTVVVGLGWLILLEVVAGVLGLPILVMMSNRYVKGLLLRQRFEASQRLVAAGGHPGAELSGV